MTDDNKEDGGHGFDDTLPRITGSMKKIFSDVSSANAAAGEKFEKFLDAYHLKLKTVSDSDSDGSTLETGTIDNSSLNNSVTTSNFDGTSVGGNDTMGNDFLKAAICTMANFHYNLTLHS